MEAVAVPSVSGRAAPREAAGSSCPKVAIVVLNWNDGAATLACLKALAGIDYPNVRVIVVDNGSTDGSADRVRKAGDAEFVVNATNLGYTGGVNVGIERALAGGAAYVWLLNSDAITQPDVLSRLVAVAEADERIGLVSPVFHDPEQPDVPSFCLGRFDPVSRYTTQTDDPAVALDWRQRYADQTVLLGTALLVSRRLVETIGVLDTTFFAYVEDVDYCLRARAAGFLAVAVADAVVLHRFKQPADNPGTVPAYLHYFITRNYLLLWRKLPGPALWRRAGLWFLHQRLGQIGRMRGIQPAVEAVLAGLWDGVRGVGGPYQPDRRAPWLLRATLGRHPDFWRAALAVRVPFRRAVR